MKILIAPLALPLLLAAGLGGCQALQTGPVGAAHVPAPAKAVALDRYVGRWYEIGRYENGFEKDCEGVTAEYAALPDGKVAVTNTCRKGAPDGPVKVARGKAKVVPGSDNARLKVSFFGPFYVGDYWVLDHAEDYSWSIVGEPRGRYLWLLSRVPEPAPEVRAAIMARVRSLGYDTALVRAVRQPPA